MSGPDSLYEAMIRPATGWPLCRRQPLWVAVDETGVTIWNAPFWQQRLTDDEAQRLVEIITAGLKRRST